MTKGRLRCAAYNEFCVPFAERQSDKPQAFDVQARVRGLRKRGCEGIVALEVKVSLKGVLQVTLKINMIRQTMDLSMIVLLAFKLAPSDTSDEASSSVSSSMVSSSASLFSGGPSISILSFILDSSCS